MVWVIPILLSLHSTARPGWTPLRLAAPLMTPLSQELMLQISSPNHPDHHEISLESRALYWEGVGFYFLLQVCFSIKIFSSNS